MIAHTSSGALIWMQCQGRRKDHGDGLHAWVPFIEAIHNPPLCHGLPRLTSGGVRMQRLAERWRESGPVLECRFTGKCEGQGVSCYSHGWSGVYHDLTRDPERCPAYQLAAWLMRRHEEER